MINPKSKSNYRFSGLFRVITTTILLVFVRFGLQAQDSIPNGLMENWVNGGAGQYQTPAGNWWTSLNSLASLGAPVTVEKTTDAFQGGFAAKLTTKQWGSILLAGLLVSGRFDFQNPNFLIQGQPFIGQPERFFGAYKYSPVNGDSAGIAALLIKWNTSTNKRDTIAEAAFVEHNNVGTWTSFDLPFVYSQPGIAPDSILLAVVSSFGGQNFQGQVGSTLWIDALGMGYVATSAAAPQVNELDVFLEAQQGRINIRIEGKPQKYSLRILDLNGKVLHTQPVQSGSNSIEFEAAAGVYFAEISVNGASVWRKKWASFQ